MILYDLGAKQIGIMLIIFTPNAEPAREIVSTWLRSQNQSICSTYSDGSLRGISPIGSVALGACFPIHLRQGDRYFGLATFELFGTS